MSIRMIATDLDGTALMHCGHLSEATKSAFRRAIAQGYMLVIATGRSLTALPEDLMEIEGISFIITSNGSSIFKMPETQRIVAVDMKPETVRKILTIAEACKTPLEAFLAGRSYCSADYYEDPIRFNGSPSSFDYVRRTRTPVADMNSFIREHIHEIEGMDFIVSDPTAKAEIHQTLLHVPNLYITSSADYYLELADIGVSKAAALRKLAGMYGIKREEIMAFGDGINDMEMLSFAGTGVAMGNAGNDLKAIADDVTLSNNEDGIARYLENYLK